jgi:hypothetical protein
MSQVSNPRKSYSTDLTDEQWALIEPLIPSPKNRWGGRPRTIPMREVVNTILYINRTGCQWGYLPHDLLPKSSDGVDGVRLSAVMRIASRASSTICHQLHHGHTPINPWSNEPQGR